MGSFIAVLRKDGGDAAKEALKMLSMTAHGRFDSFGLASYREQVASRDLNALKGDAPSSSTLLGYKFLRVSRTDLQQPIVNDGFALVLEGRLYSAAPDIDLTLKTLKVNLKSGLWRLIDRYRGAFSFAVAQENLLYVGRDPVGLKPLYYGESGNVCAVASERKAFIPLGIKDVRSFPPGNLAQVDGEGFKFKPVRAISKPEVSQLNRREILEKLEGLLFKSVERRLSDVKRVALAFSGGLDSTVIARICDLLGADVKLLTVGVEGLSDLRKAEEAAEHLGLPVELKLYNPNEVVERLPEVVWITESPNPINNAIAIPFLWVAESAAKSGRRVLFFGQGSDELFGGYHRYLETLRRFGPKLLAENLFKDVRDAYLKNLERDVKVCLHAGVEARFPYMDYDLAEFALSIPLDLKVSLADGGSRKLILRRLALRLNIPESIAKARKRAVQYSTGVDKVLRKVAKEKGVNLRSLFSDLYLKAFEEYSNLKT